MCFRTPERRRQYICRYFFSVLVVLPIASVLTEGSGKYGASDMASKGFGRLGIILRDVIAQRSHQLRPRISVEFLSR
jgi:hypothetical protein